MELKVRIKKQLQFNNSISYNVGDIVEVIGINDDIADDIYLIKDTNYALQKFDCEILKNE